MRHVHERPPGANAPYPSLTPETAAGPSGDRTILLRIRVCADTVADLDRTAKNIGARLHRKIARASLLRSMVAFCIDKIEFTSGLEGLFQRDRVRRGRARRAAS